MSRDKLTGAIISRTKCLVGNPERRGTLEDLDLDEMIQGDELDTNNKTPIPF
jgi:hypothetical protein